MKFRLLILAFAPFLLLSCGAGSGSDGTLNLLVFSKTESFRHESIEDGIEMFKALSVEHGFDMTATEETSVFSEKYLKEFDVLIFLNTTGDVLNDSEQLEMRRFIQAGGGFVGIHAAADTEYGWPWYGKLVGAYFNGHPNNPNVRDAEVERLDSQHISCNHLPARWARTDEWYNYKDIQEDIHVLLNLDESTYEGGTNGSSHPIAWYKEFDGGRTWYTGGGHTRECFREADFVQHIWGGVQWVAEGEVDYSKDNVVPAENRFEKVVLEDNLNEPMELEMLPDGRLLFVERKGDIKIYDPATEKTTVVDHLDIHTEFEDGLLGLTLDPNFADNNWLYLFYSPLGDEPKQHISRFTFTNDKLDRDSEQVLLEIGTQRDECCHSAGSIEFDKEGNLWFSAGDDTNPFASDGYSPSDERPGRSAWDAQKSSANTMDLRGKISRITPQPDGTYTIPDGNLFPKDGSVGRPEIYAMGCRNPYRFSIDSETGFLYWGDVGPDANKDSLGRGARGHDEVNQARKAGFFGWPYFIADNKPYHEYDFGKKKSLDKYNASKPINNSPNNTGARELPPAQPAFIYYPYAESEEFPLVGTGGRNAMAGPIFHASDYPESAERFPLYYDGKLFTYDWIRGWIMAVTTDDEGNFVAMERFMPSYKFSNPNDIIMGPAGDFYMLEYGTGWFKKNKDARLVHITYNAGNRKPALEITAPALAGAVPFVVDFASEANDPDGDDLKYRWDFGDGQTSSETSPTHTYTNPGSYDVKLVVTDRSGETAEASLRVGAGNEPPKMDIAFSGNQSFYWPGSQLDYEVKVSDKEDGELGAGIDDDAVALSIDYLPQGKDINLASLGHQQVSKSTQFLVGKDLIEGSDCRACHLRDAKSVGPSYLQVADKYRDQSDAADYLSDKILNGGGGVWGETVMAAHPGLEKEEAVQIAEYILSLSETAIEDRKPVRGSFAFPAENNSTEGSYLFIASYTDQGAEGVDPISVQEIIRLQSPQLAAVNYLTNDKAMKFAAEADQLAQVGIEAEGSLDILLGMDDGWVNYGELDLTGITAIEAQVVLIPGYSAGGKISIMAGTDETGSGDLIGELDAAFVPANMGLKTYSIPIKATTGKKHLIMRFDGNEDKMFGTVISLKFVADQDAL